MSLLPSNLPEYAHADCITMRGSPSPMTSTKTIKAHSEAKQEKLTKEATPSQAKETHAEATSEISRCALISSTILSTQHPYIPSHLQFSCITGPLAADDRRIQAHRPPLQVRLLALSKRRLLRKLSCRDVSWARGVPAHLKFDIVEIHCPLASPPFPSSF